MLLEELTDNFGFLDKVLGQLSYASEMRALLKKDVKHNADALTEAVALYNWALQHSGSFQEHFQALGFALSGRSDANLRTTFRTLGNTGFLQRNPLLHKLHTALVVKDRVAIADLRPDAIRFIKAVRSLFRIIHFLGEVATPDTLRYEAADGLDRNIAAATLKRLGIKPNDKDYTVNAW